MTKHHVKKTTDWKNQIPGSFGCADLKFASHRLDEERAKKLFRAAFRSGASINDLIGALRDYLEEKKALKKHIKEQIGRAMDFKFGEEPWRIEPAVSQARRLSTGGSFAPREEW